MRDTLGDTVGGFTLFLLCRHLENTLCQLGSCPPPRGCDIIKGKNAVLQFSLMKSFLCHHFCFLLRLSWQNACSVCQTRVPGLPGQKGDNGSPGAQGGKGMVGEKVQVPINMAIWKGHCKHIYLNEILCITFALCTLKFPLYVAY